MSLVNFFALMFLLSPRIGGVGRASGRLVLTPSIIALVPLALVAYWVWWGLDASWASLGAQIVSVGLAYVSGGAAYCLAAWTMRMSELRDVINLAKRRREPRSTEEVVDVDREG